MNFNSRKSTGHKVDLTPMIDVVFLLIIFFMVISRFSSQERTMVDLPPAKDADTKIIATQQQKVIINILRSGEVRIDDLAYSSSELSELLTGHKNDKILIRSDKSCTWQQLKPVFNACSQAQIASPDIAVMKE